MKNKITNKKSPSKSLKDNNNDGRIIDKKIIVRLAVVLITLLSLIIGASYAYFAVTGNNSATRAGIASTTGGVGTVSLVNPTPNLHVNLTAGNMDEEVKGSILYGTDDVNLDYDEEEIPRSIAKATVVGGDDNVEYTCTFDLSVALTGTMAEVLKANDASIIFSGIYEGVYDLTSPDLNRVITIRGLTGINREENLYVVVKVNNKTTTQDYLQGKHLEIELSHSNFSCDMKTIENEEDTYTVVYNQILPAEYQEVEYIQSTGTQYINPNVTTKTTTNYMIDFQPTTKVTSWKGIFGVRPTTNSQPGDFSIWISPTTMDGVYVVVEKTSTGAISITPYERLKVELSPEKELYVNNELKRKFTTSLSVINKDILIGTVNQGNASGNVLPAKIYQVMIREDNDIIRNMIPCYRKSDNVRGLYDMVSKTFFTNAGTGTFNIGSNVTNGYHEVKSQQFVYGTAQNLLSNDYVIEGYTASGWTTKPNGGGKFYADGALVNNLSSYNGEIINLYSKWVAEIYSDNLLSQNQIFSSVNQGDAITFNNGIYTINKSSSYSGLYIPESVFEVGKTYLLSYKIKKTAGTLQNIGGHAATTIQKSFTIDGEDSVNSYDQPHKNDGNIADDTNVHSIKFKFVYTGVSANSSTKDVYIQPNRAKSYSVTAQIYDIELREVSLEDD